MPDRQKIVVVEDDPGMRTALGRLLTAGGYSPVSFGSAEEFLAASPRDRPACFVLDIHLGAMSGLDLQRLLRVGGCTVPVILMTAFDDEATRATVDALDGSLLFHKPFNIDDLRTAVLFLLRRN